MAGDPRLQWHDVSAPDFSTALQALQQAGSSFNSGLNAAKTGFDAVDTIKNNNVNKDFALAMARYTDPVELQKALAADPTLGVDPSRLSMESINSEQPRINTLLNTANAQFAATNAHADRDQLLRERGFSNEDVDAFRGARSVLNGYSAAMQSDPTGAAGAAFLKDPANAAVLAKLTPAQYQAAISGGQDLNRGELGLSSTRESNAQTTWNDTNTRQDYADNNKSIDLSAAALKENLNPNEVPGWFATHHDELLSQGYSEKQIELGRSRAMAQLTGFGPPPAGGPVGPGATSGAPLEGSAGMKNSYDVVLGDNGNGNSYGFAPPKPVSQMTAGEAYDYGRKVMIPTTAKAGVGNGQGSSALGRYQIVGTTLAQVAPKVLGANWRDQQLTPEVQDKLGKYIFENNKGNLKGQWSSLTPQQAEAMKTMSWDQAKDIIAKGESTVRQSGSPIGTIDPRAAQHSIQAYQTGAKLNLARNPDLATAADFVVAGNDISSNARQIAQKLTGKGGEFEGENVDNVESRISQIMGDHKDINLSAAVAGRILARSADGGKTWGQRQLTNSWWGDGLNTHVSDKKIDANIAIYKDKNLMKRAAGTINETASATQDSTAALQLYTQARTAYLTRLQAARARGIANPDLSREAAAVQQTEAMLRQAGGRIQGMDVSGNNDQENTAAADLRRSITPPPKAPAPKPVVPSSRPGGRLMAPVQPTVDPRTAQFLRSLQSYGSVLHR